MNRVSRCGEGCTEALLSLAEPPGVGGCQRQWVEWEEAWFKGTEFEFGRTDLKCVNAVVADGVPRHVAFF